LPQTCVDDLESGITKGARDDLRAAIVSIETGLCNEYANAFRH
jgi:hypothetical protein